MKNQSYLILLMSILLSSFAFTSCENDIKDGKEDEPELMPFVRDISKDDLNSLKFATIESYIEMGWSFLVLHTSNDQYGPKGISIKFNVDLDKDNNLKTASIQCKDTDSFKWYKDFKCNGVNYIPNDELTIERINDNLYNITYKFIQDDQVFEGTYTGEVLYRGLTIDYHPDCYK